MKGKLITWRSRALQFPVWCMRRFPVGLLFSVAAAGCAILLNHMHGGLSDQFEDTLSRVLYLWPFALFGNVAWVLRCEVRKKNHLPGLGALCLLLVVGWFMLSYGLDDSLSGFWFVYWPALLGWLFLLFTSATRRAGDPSLCRLGWSVLLSAFMATLSAAVMAGGLNLALFSIDNLFGISVNSKVYFDVMLVGFFLVGPLAAFIWLPGRDESFVALPKWIVGAVRIILIPLCVLYALILFIYIGKIALMAQWPDGWVAMPTLIFAAIGMVVYLVLRDVYTLEERGGWPVWFCRSFPMVLLPLTIVLLLAMRVRVLEYGFTGWRTAGLYLGGWLFLFAVVYTARPRLSAWWIGMSLAVLLGMGAGGPVSLNTVARRSQQARVNQILDELDVWQRPAEAGRLEVSGAQGKNLVSSLQYLTRTYGMDGLPTKVAERWQTWRKQEGKEPIGEREWRRFRADDVIDALGLRVVDTDSNRYITIQCKDGLDIGGWHYATAGGGYQRVNEYFRLDNDFQLLADGQPIATQQAARLAQALNVLIAQTDNNDIDVPPEQFSFQFSDADQEYMLLIADPVIRWKGREEEISYQTKGARFMLFSKE